MPDLAARPPKLRLLAYGPEGHVEKPLTDLDEIEELRQRWPTVWVNVDGLGDAATLWDLARRFGLHRLAVEDVASLGQRAKVEPYERELFVVARMPTDLGGHTEQISLFLGEGYVLTFQETEGDCFEPVRRRIREGNGRIRAAGPDYLAYALIDAVVDSYFPLLEALGDRLEELEDEVFKRPRPEVVNRIHEIKRALVALRKAVWPHREMVSALMRDAPGQVSPETGIYLRDCYDHVIRVIDLLEAYRELSSDLMNGYLSSLSNRMNEVMKVLTIIATIFIPLGFIAGVYGMNFDRAESPWNMPELGWYLGYPFALMLMAGIGVGLAILFWRKGWFR